MVMRGLPSARIRWPPPVVIIMNGNPQAVIPTYSWRQREHLVRRAEQLQQRRQEHLRDRHQHNAAYQHHKHGVSYEIRSAFAVAPPHAEVKAARAAYSEKQRQRQAGGRKRKSDVRGCVSELTYGLPDKKLVHYVVQRANQHCNYAWHGKFDHQGSYRGVP